MNDNCTLQNKNILQYRHMMGYMKYKYLSCLCDSIYNQSGIDMIYTCHQNENDVLYLGHLQRDTMLYIMTSYVDIHFPKNDPFS